LRRTRAGLPASAALLGFAGAPFTLAAYAIEGGTSKAFLELRKLMMRDAATWELLMEKLARIVADHLAFQVESGAESLVLFDTWASLLTREDYRRYAEPWTRHVVAAVAPLAPLVLFAGQSEHLFDDQCRLAVELGAAGIAVDHRMDLAQAFARSGGKLALQGNFDPGALLATREEVTRRTHALLDSVAGRPGHVLNLGHGVLQATDPECVAALVEAAREARR